MREPPHILIACGNPSDATSLQSILEEAGFRVSYRTRGREAMELALAGELDALITEVVFEDIGGKELIHDLLARHPRLPIFVRTGFPDIEDAFDLARLGVRAYSSFDEEPESVAAKVAQELKFGDTDEEVDETATLDESGKPLFSEMVARNREMRNLFRTAIGRISRVSSTVLLTGESGTGKELLARTIHLHSSRASKPFVAVNCAALPESLVESELFGHEKGAFTGAAARRIGRFEAAEGGTFFLDEVGDLPMPVQRKLLRVLQERSIERVGSSVSLPVDVRVIAATHRDLATLVKAGRFREDLYYRLCVIPLHLPPLRERPDDIPGLARLFVERFRRETGRPLLTLTAPALQAMMLYHWPGNVRELENAIERAVVLAAGDRIDLADLPEVVRVRSRSRENSLDLRSARARFEKDYIQRTLERHGGNITASASSLGLARKNLQQKIALLEIDVEAIREAVGASGDDS